MHDSLKLPDYSLISNCSFTKINGIFTKYNTDAWVVFCQYFLHVFYMCVHLNKVTFSLCCLQYGIHINEVHFDATDN